MEVRAKTKYIHVSPQKVKLVADMVRGKSVREALGLLRFSTRSASRPVAKVIQSAAANAEENYGLSRDDLYVARICADKGPTLKRASFGARGRFKPILKRSAHVTVILQSMVDSAQ